MWSDFEVNAWITFPKEESDKFIFFASSNVSPIAPVLETFSLPAKSTKFNIPFFIKFYFFNICIISIIIIECERDDVWFNFVSPTFLLLSAIIA